jgi:cyclohexanone monooxygenase
MPYIGGVGAYRQKCEAVAANGYEGFAFEAAYLVPISFPSRKTSSQQLM